MKIYGRLLTGIAASLAVTAMTAQAAVDVCDYGSFFFSSRRRHTRFDCDWSSDVCSSDLIRLHRFLFDLFAPNRFAAVAQRMRQGQILRLNVRQDESPGYGRVVFAPGIERSEERRVGEEGRSRWSPDHLKKKKKK